MNETYFNDMERTDDRYLYIFNEKMHFFIMPKGEKRETKPCTTIDRQLIDKKGRKCAVELKMRYCDINTYDGIFCTQKQWEALEAEYKENGKIPLYINFFQDYKNVLIYDLRDYFDRKKTFATRYIKKVKNIGYEKTEENTLRYILPQRHGIFYQYDDNEETYKRKW